MVVNKTADNKQHLVGLNEAKHSFYFRLLEGFYLLDVYYE